jgi:hypothetical protein
MVYIFLSLVVVYFFILKKISDQKSKHKVVDAKVVGYRKVQITGRGAYSCPSVEVDGKIFELTHSVIASDEVYHIGQIISIHYDKLNPEYSFPETNDKEYFWGGVLMIIFFVSYGLKYIYSS